MSEEYTSPLSLPPLGLYIHIPWCLKKCPYCDFNSHAFEKSFPENEYKKALLNDLENDLAYVQGRTLQSIFIGGGTPSLFSPESYAQLLSTIQSAIPFSEDMEITLEANPGTFEQNKFADFRHTGINRLSIGIQSFQSEFLSRLGRVHSANEALQAADIAQSAGFQNFNLDLMFGLPGQNTEQAMDDLNRAIQLKPSHISWYQLTIEPNTVFYSQPPDLPEAELIESIQDEGLSLLESENFNRYEISAFSKPGKQAQHNLNYWQFGDYIGIGAGAHGKISLPEQKQIIRTRKTRQPQTYLDANESYLAEAVAIPRSDLVLEFMMNALRLREGVAMEKLEARTGIDPGELSAVFSKLQQEGLMQTSDLCTTPKGYNLLNNVLQAFMI